MTEALTRPTDGTRSTGIYRGYSMPLPNRARLSKRGNRFILFSFRIWIGLTDHCNLKCPLCPNEDLPKETKGYIPPGFLRRLWIKSKGRSMYGSVPPGRTLASSSSGELIHYAQSRGLPCRIHTDPPCFLIPLPADSYPPSWKFFLFLLTASTPPPMKKIAIRQNLIKPWEISKTFYY